MRSLLFKDITIPIAFKAIRCSRRAQLWNRQASIIRDLTKLAFRCNPLPGVIPHRRVNHSALEMEAGEGSAARE